MKTKTALITGATGGIGQEFARILSQKDYRLILIGRNEKKLQQLVKELSPNSKLHQYFVCDLSKEKDLLNLTKSYPAIDLLINNAGFSDYGFYPNLSWEKQKQMIQVNVVALSYLCHFYLKGMVKKGNGQILNVASTGGTKPAPFTSIYTGTKAFVIQFSQSLALELKGTNIIVSCLLPGPTSTEFWQKAGMSAKVKGKLDRLDKPSEVAKYGIYLLEKNKISGIYGFRNKIKQLIKNFLPEKIWFWLIRKHMLMLSKKNFLCPKTQ